jgi:MOSC domain-containing protein YiiM
MSTHPHVEAIHLAAEWGAPMEGVDRVEVIAGSGLAGDRYCGVLRKGAPYPQGAITLIEGETIDALAAELSLTLSPGETRRNITTRSVRLNDLVGRRFRLGEAVLEGYELCRPCKHLQTLTEKPLLSALRDRGGLRAYIIEGAVIAVGEAITV